MRTLRSSFCSCMDVEERGGGKHSLLMQKQVLLYLIAPIAACLLMWATISLFTLRSSSRTRGHDLKIYKPHATCLPRRHFYSVRIINDWNGLPYDSVNVHSTNLFKTHLDRFYYDYQYDIV